MLLVEAVKAIVSGANYDLNVRFLRMNLHILSLPIDNGHAITVAAAVALASGTT